jgi:hypothetical protein
MEDVELLKQASTKSFATIWKNVILCNVARWHCKGILEGHGTLKPNTQIPLNIQIGRCSWVSFIENGWVEG